MVKLAGRTGVKHVEGLTGRRRVPRDSDRDANLECGLGKER
jgi:hypothetical protein